MKSLHGLLAALAAASAVATCAPAEKAPDTILYNGRITTLDDETGPASALAIRDGRVIAVGGDAQIRDLAGAATRTVDLGGHRVIPGLIDNHDHVIRATEYWTWEARLDGVTSREESVRILQAKAASLPPEAWLLVLGGWGEEQFTDDPRGFSRAELDAIAPDRPAFLQVRYDYAFANSAWFAAMGLPLAIAPGSPPGEGLARFVERDADGQATGRLDGGFPMIALATRGFPAVTEETQRAGIEALSETLLGYGITSVFDPGGLGIRPESYSRLQAMADAGALRLRFFYSLWDGVVNTPEGAQHLIHRLETETPFGAKDEVAYFHNL
ncbi:MAG: amidohydrolase family protein, partial [Rhodothalassiaceae bacterium]